MKYRVVFAPEAQGHLEELYNFIATAASPDVAAGYVESEE